jgi:hypothetical protein
VALAGALLTPVVARADAALGAQARFRALQVDVGPLRRTGDTTSADVIGHALPAFLHQYFARYLDPGDRRAPILIARIDMVQYGVEGSAASLLNNNGAMYGIQGAGVVVGGGGRTIATYPMASSILAHPNPNDITGETVRRDMTSLAQSFAQWLPGQMGLN